MQQKVDDFRLKLGEKEYIPIMIGGMGVDISTSALALEACRLGGIGHISDAMSPTINDRLFGTKFVKNKLKNYKHNVNSSDKTSIKFNLEELAEAQKNFVSKTMQAKQGEGGVFINCMEILSMNGPRETLQVRMQSALDAGIEGITLSAGLHLGSFELIQDHPRFHDAKLGIIVSSVRALRPFLKRASRTNRMPDYVVVEGPLAGGHLGFGMDWAQYQLKEIVIEVQDFLKENDLEIPVIPAGGIFTGTDAVEYFERGASAIQVATRFTVTEECGLPDGAKQSYFEAEEEDVVVNTVSPTGYPMRMLQNSPGIGSGIRPNCEAFGYVLDKNGQCAYVDAYFREAEQGSKKISVPDKVCLCTHFRNYKIWTCGHTVYRLKDTTNLLDDGTYQILTAEHVFRDYQFSTDHSIQLPVPDLRIGADSILKVA
jgi:nitronate monooxygenase